MNLDQITTKNFILALFKRDDGERILLGAGLYEFKDGLQHFQPNTIANDIVEKQGTDGQLLAGQVLRSSAQPFDGFIGDATTTRPNIENARRAFIQYFQTNHRYKVIYIMPDGTAIQRQNGYLVDAPSVPEMIQKFPAYHVALAFEDIHYYSYAENPDGSETYAQIFSIDPSGILTGGLVWIANGVEWDGPGMALNAIKGATSQASYTGKNLYNSAAALPESALTHSANTTASATSSTITVTNTTATDGFAPMLNASSAKLSEDIYVTLPVNTNIRISFKADRTTGIKVLVYGYNEGTNTHTNLVTLTNTNGYTLSTGSRTQFALRFGNTISNSSITYSNIMFEIGTSTTSFEPYVGGIPSPNPDYPQPIRTVTGSQTITIGGTAYPLDLGTIELAEIGTAQDRIYKDGSAWKIEKQTKTEELDGSADEGWTSTATNVFASVANGPIGVANTPVALSTHAVFNPVQTSVSSTIADGEFAVQRNNPGTGRFFFKNTAISTAADFKTWLAANTPHVILNLHTPTTTTITDAGLIAQLEAIETALATGGAISITPSGSNLAAIIDAPANGTGGAIWETSGGTSAQPVTNNGIASAQPIWTVDGLAENPSITNETTGQTLTFTGTVPNGQTLIVDCGAQTASIAGVDAKAQMTGNWLTIEPGTNLITYSGANVTGPSTLKWNEVVE